jgi:hypothetical protein
VPPETGPGTPCPLPFVSQARLEWAVNELAGAFQGAMRAYLSPKPRRPLEAAEREAADQLQTGKARDPATLELVAYYGLLREIVPDKARAERDHWAGARLAVWRAVHLS